MRHLWIAIGLAVATIAAPPASALDGRIAALAAPNTPWDEGWTEFKKHIAANAPDIHFDYFIRGELGNEDDMLSALRRNRVQIMGSSLQGLATLVPELTVAMAPYIFDSPAEVDFVYDNYLFEPAAMLLRQKGIVLLRWNEVGWTDFYSNRPVRVPADAADLKIRGAPNVSAQVFLRGIGANSVPIGSVDIVPALQRGLVVGGTSNLIFHYFMTRQYASYVTFTHHSYDTGGTVAYKDWWDGATEEGREQVLAAFGSSADHRRLVRDFGADILDRLRKEGIVVIEPTPQERAQWIAKTRPLVQEIIGKVGGEAQAFYDAIMAGKAAFAARNATGSVTPADSAASPSQPGDKS